MENNKPTISMPEAFLMLSVAVAADIFELITVLLTAIPYLGPMLFFIPYFENLIVLSLIEFWLRMKGVKSVWWLGGGLTDFIPFMNALPFKTVALLTLITKVNLEARHPTLARAVGAVERVI